MTKTNKMGAKVIHFDKILIANRGEIALRVMRSAQAMGYGCVAVYSEADRDAPHVSAADQAVCIGPAPVAESYLNADKIIAAAKLSGAQAIHPGYGFLSENSAFAEACAEANIHFIGPPAAAIELMGNKRLAKIAMQEAGVPCIKGYDGAEQSNAALIAKALEIGFPLMIKAAAGGGGRGMRLVETLPEDADKQHQLLAEQLDSARSEALNAFGSGELILEQALIDARHIEIQVFADQHGHCVYLGERDCSIQRRHQKVVEEAPSPFVDQALRQRMGEAAVQAAKACDYVGAGTVEFLVDADKNFYFLEMNTRLQVEHPVTEIITGTDLVQWQLDVAAGLELPFTQSQISLEGHAIEVRLYAEDPRQNFLPQTGLISKWQAASGKGMRVDAGIRSEQEVSPFYDPMLAKVIGYGRNREEARRRLLRALEQSHLFGVNSNSEFLAGLLSHEEFVSGRATTEMINQHFNEHPSMQAQVIDAETASLAALLFHLNAGDNIAINGNANSALLAPHITSNYRLQASQQDFALSLSNTQASKGDEGGRYHIELDNSDHAYELTLIAATAVELCYELNGMRQSLSYHLDGKRLYLHIGQGYYQFEDVSYAPSQAEDAASSGQIKASMDGALTATLVSQGDRVSKGQTLALLEAMKMEHPLKAPFDGTVAALHCQQGEQVKRGQVVLELQREIQEELQEGEQQGE